MASATGDDSFTLVTRKRGRRPLKSTHNPDGAAEAQPLAEGPKTVASDDSPDPATIIRRLIEPECELVRVSLPSYAFTTANLPVASGSGGLCGASGDCTNDDTCGRQWPAHAARGVWFGQLLLRRRVSGSTSAYAMHTC